MVVVVQLESSAQVAQQQGGTLGTVAATVLPGYTEQAVYQGLADEINKSLAAKGISGSARVVQDAPSDAGGAPSVARDAIPLLVGAVAGYFLAKE